MAIIEVCAVHAERSFLESQQAKQGVERVEHVLQNVMRAIKHIADDQNEMRSGIPSSWRDRLLLVILTSTLASGVAAIVVRLAG